MAHFSRQEIDEIAQRLSTVGVKDSDFPSATYISPDDFVAIVQAGVNKKLPIARIYEEISPYLYDHYIFKITPFVKNGANMLRSGYEADIEAAVILGDVDVTSQIAPSLFSWERSSIDSVLDQAWNQTHRGVGPVIHITRADVNKACTFYCLVPCEAIRNINI